MNALESLFSHIDVQTVILSVLALGILFVLAWALLSCFLGYPVFRVEFALAGLLIGAIFSVFIVGKVLDHPPLLLSVAAGLIGAPILGYAFWRFYRGFFGAWIFFRVTLGFAFFSAAQRWRMDLIGAGDLPRPTTPDWVFGVLFGICAAIIACMWAKHVIILLSGLCGGLAAVFCLAVLVASSSERPLEFAIGPMMSLWLIALLLLAALGLSAAGIWCQYKVTAWLSARFAKPEPTDRTPARNAPRKGHGDRQAVPRRKRRPSMA